MINKARRYSGSELGIGDFVFSTIGRPVEITGIKQKRFVLEGSLTADFGPDFGTNILAYKPNKEEEQTMPDEKGYLPGTGPVYLSADCLGGEIFGDLSKEQELRAALGVVLDAVDYQRGACSSIERVGAVLPVAVLQLARAAMKP